MNYIPVHKRTKQRYPQITQADKDSGDWSRYPYNAHWYFEPVPEVKSTPPPEIKKAPETVKETDPLKG